MSSISTLAKMTIRIATVADLDRLLQLSLRLASETHQGLPPLDIEATEKANRLFFVAQLESPFSRTWVAEPEKEIVAIGTLIFVLRPSLAEKSTIIEAYFVNLYTLPEYRRRGYARAILDAAKAFVQKQGLTRIWLHSSNAGRPLYEATGFQNSAGGVRDQVTMQEVIISPISPP